ncbi:MAG: nitroreductase family protein [Verrucomicrobia bacterium]|nr:nitroreductase family protein [Verrucomicrobiota bacterium]
MTDYEELLELIRARRSIRRFAARAVSRDDLLRLLEAARWAPSNHNRQPWRFLVLEDRTRIRALAATVESSLADKVKSLPAVAGAYAGELVHYSTIFAQAPVLLVALHKRPIHIAAPLLEGVAQPALVSGEPLSVAMAVQNLMLAAQALGLGTCVLTGPMLAQTDLAGALELPAGFDVTCYVAVGHPSESPEAPRRKSLEHIVEFRETAGGPVRYDERNRNS